MTDLIVAALRAGELVVDTAASVYGRFRGSNGAQNDDERESPASDDVTAPDGVGDANGDQ